MPGSKNTNKSLSLFMTTLTNCILLHNEIKFNILDCSKYTKPLCCRSAFFNITTPVLPLPAIHPILFFPNYSFALFCSRNRVQAKCCLVTQEVNSPGSRWKIHFGNDDLMSLSPQFSMTQSLGIVKVTGDK